MILESSVGRFILITQGVVMKANSYKTLIHLLGERRFKANCALAAAHGHVATPWNRATIPRRGALPCTTASTHFTSSNWGL